jgi:hypothetical protein
MECGHKFHVKYEIIWNMKKYLLDERKQRGDDGTQCLMCGTENELLQHHISYEPEDTVTLCKKCHFKVHIRLIKRKQA